MCASVSTCEAKDVDSDQIDGASEVNWDFSRCYSDEGLAIEEGEELPLVGVAMVGAKSSDCVGIELDQVELIFFVVVLGDCFVFDV